MGNSAPSSPPIQYLQLGTQRACVHKPKEQSVLGVIVLCDGSESSFQRRVADEFSRGGFMTLFLDVIDVAHTGAMLSSIMIDAVFEMKRLGVKRIGVCGFDRGSELALRCPIEHQGDFAVVASCCPLMSESSASDCRLLESINFPTLVLLAGLEMDGWESIVECLSHSPVQEAKVYANQRRCFVHRETTAESTTALRHLVDFIRLHVLNATNYPENWRPGAS